MSEANCSPAQGSARPRKDLIRALAYCVEALAAQPLMEGAGPIRAALDADSRVWDHIDQRTADVLTNGLGHTPPNAAVRDAEDRP